MYQFKVLLIILLFNSCTLSKNQKIVSSETVCSEGAEQIIDTIVCYEKFKTLISLKLKEDKDKYIIHTSSIGDEHYQERFITVNLSNSEGKYSIIIDKPLFKDYLKADQYKLLIISYVELVKIDCESQAYTLSVHLNEPETDNSRLFEVAFSKNKVKSINEIELSEPE